MHAGQLRERVTIQVAVRSTGSAGGLITAWSELKTVWARIEQDGGKDALDQGQQRESKTMKVTVRRRFVLSATEHRLVWTGRRAGEAFTRTLAILSVIDDEIGDRTVMQCEEGRGSAG